MSDERLKKPVDGRRDRAMEDRVVTENREATDRTAELMALLSHSEVLPTPPDIPGYRLTWLSTTSQADSIEARKRLGYSAVTPEEVPGFEFPTQKTGDHGSLIAVNEMVLFKIKEEDHAAILNINHRLRPARMEEGIKAGFDRIQENAAREGGRVMAVQEDY
jgi:hypothetical protein